MASGTLPTRATPVSMYALPFEPGSAAISFNEPFWLADCAKALNAGTCSSFFKHRSEPRSSR